MRTDRPLLNAEEEADDIFRFVSDTTEDSEDTVQSTSGIPEDTSDEDDEPEEGDDVSDEETKRILAKYKNDPKALAKALKNAGRKITDQGTKLNALTKSQNQEQKLNEEENLTFNTLDEEEPDANEVEQPVKNAPKVDSFVVTKFPENFKPFEFNSNRIFNPDTDAIDEDSGLPVDTNGRTFIPLDGLGLPYYPESYWDAKLEELELRFADRPTKALLELGRLKEAAEQDRREAWGPVNQHIMVTHLFHAEKERDRIATVLAKNMPLVIAKSTANELYLIARRALPQALKDGNVSPGDYSLPDALKQALTQIYAGDDVIGRAKRIGKELSKGNSGIPESKRRPVANNGTQRYVEPVKQEKRQARETDEEYEMRTAVNYTFKNF